MIRLSPDAVMDVRRLRSFVDQKSPGAARRALGEIFKALSGLQALPNRGQQIGDPRLRQINIRFGHSGYVARYRVDLNGDIVVIRIWHAREARPAN